MYLSSIEDYVSAQAQAASAGFDLSGGGVLVQCDRFDLVQAPYNSHTERYGIPGYQVLHCDVLSLYALQSNLIFYKNLLLYSYLKKSQHPNSLNVGQFDLNIFASAYYITLFHILPALL